ncbi:rod shape-determining protein [Aristaeella lactis]|uniref:Rod shape-determining protein MreB n=1 Tax=Aristaeella lactis TaxID=3046383 RepID=A0AC61PIX4_9FIRM|nr:rod shape-determining protein [Aristaeella lactis]QUA53884.1 rod shape-determining protein [Aristaeella lactis]SMC40464.1 rod shape-determining protein MreB [Aristaeella lactis]
MPFLAPDIGIDLGTENINVYVRGRGIVISEPTLVVLSKENRNTIRAVGDEARFLYGRSPDTLIAVSPIRNGQVADFDIAELMFRYFIRKAVGVSYLGKPRIIISVPCGMDDVNRKALTEAIRMAGARHVFLIEKPFASAIGTGLPVYDPIGSLVVDIGAGTTDIAVISLGGLVVSQSVQVGGNKFNEAIADYLRRECNILIGSQTADNIKKDLASALPLNETRTIMVRGVNQLNTSAGTVSFTSDQAYDAVKNPCGAIVKAIRWVLERTPPELAADIMKSGIHLTGDGAKLFALDRYISESLGMPVLLARDPGDCCILGIGYLTENIQLVTPQDKRSRPSIKQ